MEPKGSYKYIEFTIFILAVFLFVKYSGFSFRGEKAGAFEWEKEVNIYFPNFEMGSVEDCSQVFPVERMVPNAENLGPASIDALLKGPTREERENAFITLINADSLMQKFELKGGTAYIDFNSPFNQGIAGSCTVIAIRSQIENTLLELPGIESVIISVDGETEGILEP